MEQASLSYTLGSVRHEVPCVADVNTLGRSKEMTIIFPESAATVSRLHATLRRQGARWVLEDSTSRHGTFLNGSRITSAALHDGDRIRLGSFDVCFHLRAPAAPAAKPGSWRPAVGTRRPDLSEVVFGDIDCPNVGASIELAHFDMNQETLKALQPAAETSLAGATPATSARLAPAVETVAPKRVFGPEQRWAIGLFNDVGRAMQVSTDLGEMLEDLLNLILMQVPADFAVIGLIDRQTGKIVPRAIRASQRIAADAMTISETVVRSALDQLTAVVVNNVAQDERYQGAVSLQMREVHSVMCVPLYEEGRAHGVVYLDSRHLAESFDERTLEIVTAVALFSAIAIEQFSMRERVREQTRQRERLSRYISSQVVDHIVHAGGEAQMLADKGEVSVLFCDLRGFASLAEKLPPTEVVEQLNAVLSLLAEAIFRHQGTLDKFLGDGLMAFFGAPLRSDDHACQAVRAAWDMLAALDRLNESRPPESQLGIRIGINTGTVVVGDIGSLERKDYTVVGDTVNVASRFESSVAQVGQIVIGPATREALCDEFECEPLPPVTLKGRSEPIQPFRVISRRPSGMRTAPT
jgi:adenylate cyclase